MSDRQSKNNDGAAKSFSARGLGATNAGISASIARRNQEKIVGKSQRCSSSCDYVQNPDLEELSAARDFIGPQKRKRNQLMPAPRVGLQKNDSGNDSANMNMDEFVIQIIDEAEFKSKKICSASKTRHSLREEPSEGFPAASSWRNNLTTKSQNGNGKDDIDPEENEIEIIDEAEFFKLKTNLMSKRGFSSKENPHEGYSAVTPRKDVCKKASSADCRESFCSEDACNGSNHARLHKSSSFVQRGKKAGLKSCSELKIKQIEEAEFLNEKTRFASKIWSSTKQGYSAANSRKPPLDNYHGSFSSEDPCRDSDKVQTDKSSSFTGKGKNDEDTDFEEFGIEKIDESEFRKLCKKRSSNVKIVKNKRKREVLSCSRKKKRYDAWKKDLHNDVNDGRTSSYSGSKSSSDNISTSLPDDEVTAYGSKHEMNLGVASRTRSKMESLKKPADFGNFSLGLSHDSDFSSSFEGESSDSFDGKEEFSSRKKQLSNDASSKQSKGGSEVDEESEEINRTFGHDAKAEEGLKERNDCPKCTCSKQSYAQNNSDEAKGVNGLHPKDQSQGKKKEASPSHSKDDYNNIGHDDDDDIDDIHEKLETTITDFHGHDKIGTPHVTDEIKEPTRRKQVSLKDNDYCSMLADVVLGQCPLPETKGSDEEAMQAPPCQTQNTLPTKFLFEDEVQKVVEKTEHEKEVEGLFAELDVNWQLEELGSFNYAEVDQENENPPAEETHHARCARGKHELVLQEDEGLICIFCYHVELGPKDILPELVDKSYQDSKRKRYSEAEQPLEFDELHLESSINNAADFGSGTVWSLKPGIRESMFEHQREGFEFLWKNLAGSINLDEVKRADSAGVGGCIISHAPGSGKTRLTINFIETYLKVFPNSMPVIIGPASMLLTWEEEFKKWKVGFPFLNLNSPESLFQEKNKAALGLLARAKRQNSKVIRMVKICTWSMGRSVLGISYSLFEKMTGEKYMKGKESQKRNTLDDQMEKIRKILLEKPGLVFLDEGHTPRNQRSNIWNALLKLKTGKRVILSGTPFQNNFAELFNTLRLVRPAIAGALAKEKMYAEMIATRRMSKSQKYNKGEHSQSPSISQVIDRAVDKLKISMAPFVHIHKGDILQQKVPGLRDCVILLKPSALQKTLIERLEGSSTFEFEHRVALISVHPYLLQHIDSTEEQKSGIDMAALVASKLNPNEGVKTKFILELVRLSVVLKEKVLIFSQYLQPLELIKEQLKEIFKWVVGKEILQMQGSLEQKHRQILINSFNDSKSESKIMLASTKCCSEGISLIGASRVVLLDVVWNPSVERQAICRAYRVGQEKFVYTYHLMTSGTTEADKYCRQAEKERLSELVFSNSSNESNKQKQASLCIEDRVLEEMVGHDKLKEMFEKIINQPKDKDLIQTFGLTS